MAMRPTTWWPGINGYCTSRRSPCQAWTSAPEIAVASTASQPPAATGWEGIFVAASCRGSTSTMALAACPSSTMGRSVGHPGQAPVGGASDRVQSLRYPLHAPLEVVVREGIGEAGVAGRAERLAGNEGDTLFLEDPPGQVEGRGEALAQIRRQVGEHVERTLRLEALGALARGEDLHHLAATPVERLPHLLHRLLASRHGGESGALGDVGHVRGQVRLETDRCLG